MTRVAAFLALAALLAGTATAQPFRKERDVGKQRAAVAAWTACIADEQSDRVASVLVRDFRSRAYKSEMLSLAKARVSKACFEAMPREYRRIELGGLPFAGGLAEQMIKRGNEPLVRRLSTAALAQEVPTYSASDRIAMCVVRGAPHLAARLFETPVSSSEEAEALAGIKPAADVCAAGAQRLEASALGMRSMLATASFRLLAASGGVR